MAINLITQPDATVPITGADYTQQNLLINAALAQGDEVLTDWAESTAAPAIKQGVYFYHSGNSYQVQDSDSSISGTPVSGANYIGLAESGGVLTASYITDISGYTWNPAYNGLYDGTTLIIRAVTYLIGSAYHRALGADKAQSGTFILANGSCVNPLLLSEKIEADEIFGSSMSCTGAFSRSSTSAVSYSDLYAYLSPGMPVVGEYIASGGFDTRYATTEPVIIMIDRITRGTSDFTMYGYEMWFLSSGALKSITPYSKTMSSTAIGSYSESYSVTVGLKIG